MKYTGAFGSLFSIIAIFSSGLFLIMLAVFIDSCFFNDAGRLALLAKYGARLLGFMMMYIFGFSFLILVYGKLQNLQFVKAYMSRLDREEALEKAKIEREKSEIKSGLMDLASSFANSDPAFQALLARFESYLGSKSGSKAHKRNQAIDSYNGGGGDMFITILGPGILIIFVIIVQTCLAVRIRNTTDSFMGEALSATRQSNPTFFLPLIVLTVLAGIYLIFKQIDSIYKNVFGFVWYKLPGSDQNEESLDTSYGNFFNQKIQYQHIPLRRTIYNYILICAYVPLISGILLMDSLIIQVAAPCMGFGILMLMFDNGKAESFVVSEKGWVRFMQLWGKTVDFSLADCEGVVVRYQSQKSNTGITSGGLERGFMNNIVTSIMGYPKLIPQAIIFFFKNEEPVVLSLRFLAKGKNNWIDSHAVEFYFAFLLKQYGFHFEVPENKELAGDWRAENPKHVS